MFYKQMPVKITGNRLAARCQVFYHKIYGLFFYSVFPGAISIRPRGYKTLVMLSSVDEILNAHKYKNINKFSFSGAISIRPRGYKTLFMLNSGDEILNAHKYKKKSVNSAFWGSDKPRMLYSPLIIVKMPTIVGILTCMSRKKESHAQLS